MATACISCQSPVPDAAAFCPVCGVATPTGAGERERSSTASRVEPPLELHHVFADRYRVERVLGQGGMATVYLAEDLRHRRKVAVKVLRPALAALLGPERFLREIAIAGQLQHPHILTLIDSGEADGLLYYVMPFVEGESLRQRLTREQQLAIGEVVRILRDVADALAYAHGRGVVHRDIKPDNVLLSERHALVVDFGVAKAVSQATEPSALTAPGFWIGTPAYMAPEQVAEGRAVDHRADIYAVGVVGYELLTGTRPVVGDTVRPLEEVRPEVPLPLARLVMRCLEKQPGDRWQRADEVLAQLEELTTRTPWATRAVPAAGIVRPRRRWGWWVAIGVSAVLVAAIGVIAGRGRARQILAPQLMPRQLTHDGTVSMGALSPDGQYLAYVVRRSPGKIVLKDLAGGTEIVVADSIGWRLVSDLRWSPDGTRVGFSGVYRGRRGIYLFPRLGGAPEAAPFQVRYPDRSFPFFTWSPDGAEIAGWNQNASGGLWVQELSASRKARTVPMPSTDDWVFGGDWSPDGRHLALITQSATFSSSLWVIDLEDGTAVLTLSDSLELRTPRWAGRGDAIYYEGGGYLYRTTVDPKSGRARGTPRRLVPLELERIDLDRSAYALSGDGVRLVYRRTTDYLNYSVAHVDSDGGEVRYVTLTTGTAGKHSHTLSPDGTALAFLQASDEGTDLYCVSTSGGTPERLTFGGSAVDVGLAWDPSGRYLAFVTRAGGVRTLAVIAASGGGIQVFEGARASQQIEWAPGPRIAYQVPGNRNFRLLDPQTGEERLLVENDSVGWMFTPKLSPDGTRVAVLWNRLVGGQGLWVISLLDGSQLLLARGRLIPWGWSADSDSVYATGDGGFRRFPAAGGPGMAVPFPERPERLRNTFCNPHERPRGIIWLCWEGESFSDLWMIENFDPEYAGRSR